MPDLDKERLSSLPRLSRDALYALWKELFGTVPSRQLRKDFMIPIVAYRIQEQAFGSLNPRSRAQLVKLPQDIAKIPNSVTASPGRPRPGTRLVRQWGNRVHVVNVENEGYEYQGTRYQSLSEVARLITGTRWSGPLFFGIQKKNPQPASKEAR